MPKGRLSGLPGSLPFPFKVKPAGVEERGTQRPSAGRSAERGEKVKKENLQKPIDKHCEPE